PSGERSAADRARRPSEAAGGTSSRLRSASPALGRRTFFLPAAASGAAGQHRTAGARPGPVGAPGGVGLAAGLVVAGPAHDLEQVVDRAGIARLRGIDRDRKSGA